MMFFGRQFSIYVYMYVYIYVRVYVFLYSCIIYDMVICFQ